MAREESFGIVPLRYASGQWFVYLVQHKAGHWAFPKGRSNPGETSRQTAVRELQEETGLAVVQFLRFSPMKEFYGCTKNGKPVAKGVIYFLAEVAGEAKLDNDEIVNGAWQPLLQSVTCATFPEAKRLCQDVIDTLTDRNIY